MPFNLQAALGYAQFQRIDELVGRKRYQLEFYRNELSDIENLKFNEESDLVYNGAWITSMIIGKSYNIDKETIIKPGEEEEDIMKNISDLLSDIEDCIYDDKKLSMYM